MQRWAVALAAVLATGVGAVYAAPRAARAFEAWQERQRRAWYEEATAALARGEEDLPPVPFYVDLKEGRAEKDDPWVRGFYNALTFGQRTRAYQHELLKIAAEENRKAASQKRAAPTAIRFVSAPVTPPTALSWDNLGPAGARSEWNGVYYQGMDTGRPTAIRVDPTDANTVYIAFSGGGVWKATNFLTGTPNWAPLTDSLGALAIGAMDIDPQNHLTVYIGTGDSFDEGGGSVLKSTDGGATWGAPVLLTGTHPVLGGFTVTASRIRQLAVDPNNANVVLATTDVGLFRSTDGAATWVVVDLPNTAAYNWSSANVDLESTWDLAYLG